MILGHSLDGAPGAWELDPLIILPAVAAIALYASGVGRLSNRGSARAPGIPNQICFYVGMLVAVGAVVTPLHGWSERLFAAHMTQHLLLVIIAAPLVVLGRPIGPFTAALPAAPARAVSRSLRFARDRARFALHPVSLWALHTFVLWVWHFPALYDAALENDLLHGLEHGSFLGTALLLWAAVLGSKPIAEGASVLLLFATGLQSAALGALLAFSTSPLYETHTLGAPSVETDPVSDQQLAGVIMWIPPGLVYLAVSALLLGRMLQTSRPGLEEVGRT